MNVSEEDFVSFVSIDSGVDHDERHACSLLTLVDAAHRQACVPEIPDETRPQRLRPVRPYDEDVSGRIGRRLLTYVGPVRERDDFPTPLQPRRGVEIDLDLLGYGRMVTMAAHAQRSPAVDFDNGEVIGRTTTDRVVCAPCLGDPSAVQSLSRPVLHENDFDSGARPRREACRESADHSRERDEERAAQRSVIGVDYPKLVVARWRPIPPYSRSMSVPRPERFTILVIDDDELVREMVVELLQTEGHRVLSASSGEDGLATVRAVRPDLILVDHHMPGMTGHEVVQRLKADASTGPIPVVALTSAGGEDVHKLSLAGAVAFIPKPFDPSEFRRLIADILSVTTGRTRRTES